MKRPHNSGYIYDNTDPCSYTLHVWIVVIVGSSFGIS